MIYLYLVNHKYELMKFCHAEWSDLPKFDGYGTYEYFHKQINTLTPQKKVLFSKKKKIFTKILSVVENFQKNKDLYHSLTLLMDRKKKGEIKIYGIKKIKFKKKI